MNEKICGTYWLVKIKDGSKFLTQGKKPKGDGDCWLKPVGNTPWLCVEGNFAKWRSRTISRTLDGTPVESSDYKDINFPDTEGFEPIEIEIGKSGRVYTYES